MDVEHGPTARASAARIAHHIPGRLRLRLSPPVAGGDVAEAVQGLPGVRSCTWSPRTGSLLVLYEPGSATVAAVTDAVRTRAAVGGDLAELSESAPSERPATLAATVTGAFGEMDREIRRTTRGAIGLGGLVPVALTLWAVREIALGRFAPLGWSSALWYAHGLFRDYNSPPS